MRVHGWSAGPWTDPALGRLMLLLDGGVAVVSVGTVVPDLVHRTGLVSPGQ